MLQMLSIFLLLGTEPTTVGAYAGLATLYAAAVLTIWSMWVYLRAAWPDLMREL